MGYSINETVEYKSQYDGEWKSGVISRFTEEGFTTCASIWEKPDDAPALRRSTRKRKRTDPFLSIM